MSNSNPKLDSPVTTLMAWATLVALTALLAACGGGGASATAAAPVQDSVDYVPAAASDGVSVFAGWMKQMSAETLDGKEAMNTRTFAPTVQENVEPVAAPF